MTGKGAVPKGIATVTMTEQDTSINGPLSPDVIKKTIRNGFPRMRACSEAALHRDITTTGLVATELEIGTDGGTEWADGRADGTTIVDQEMISCVERVFACLTFQAPEHSGRVYLRYPIHCGRIVRVVAARWRVH